MKKEILLTITMLVSDRTETIEKCMKSLKSLLERVPSELIIVDTAGNKTCMDIVKQYADKIIPFEWCNDFSKARNTGLNAAKGKWVMFLDDDEWFESTKEIEEFFLKGIYKKYASASYITRNYIDKQGTKWDDRIALRLCRMDKGLCFRGKIHEYLYPALKPTYAMKDYVHHYGYVYETEQERQEHAWRNVVPLIEQRKEDPENFHTAAQLIQEYFALGENYSALETARELNKHPMRYVVDKKLYTAYAQVMEIRLYMNLRNHQLAYGRAKSILEEKEILLLTRGCICGLMVGICGILKKYGEALEYVNQYQRLEKKWREGELKDTDLFNLERQFLNEDESKRMDLIKLNLYVKTEQWEEAEQWFQRIKWQGLLKYMMKDTVQDFIQIFMHSQYESDSHPAYKEALEEITKFENLRNFLYAEAEKVSEEKKEKILSFMVLREPTDVKMFQFYWEYYYRIKDKVKMEQLLNVMGEKKYSYFNTDKNYWKCLDEMNLNIDSYIKDISIKEYFHQVNNLYAKFDLETCEIVNRVLWKLITKEDIRYKYAKGIFLEKQLMCQKDTMEDEKIWEYFQAISKYWYSCATDLYRMEVFEGPLLSALPSRYQFAWYIVSAENTKEDVRSFSKNIAEAGKCYSSMSSLTVRYLRYVQEEKKRQAENEKLTPEMRMLAKKLKENIAILIETNQMAAASMAINQLEMFIPSDPELQRLKNLVERGNHEESTITS